MHRRADHERAAAAWRSRCQGFATSYGIVAALREQKLLAETGRALTVEGRRVVDDLLFSYQGRLPDLSPPGAFQPFRLHVAPLASGTQVVEDEAIWAFVSQAMRKTLALEMEGAALGEFAHRQRQHQLDAVVMSSIPGLTIKGTMSRFSSFMPRAAWARPAWRSSGCSGDARATASLASSSQGRASTGWTGYAGSAGSTLRS